MQPADSNRRSADCIQPHRFLRDDQYLAACPSLDAADWFLFPHAKSILYRTVCSAFESWRGSQPGACRPERQSDTYIPTENSPLPASELRFQPGCVQSGSACDPSSPIPLSKLRACLRTLHAMETSPGNNPPLHSHFAGQQHPVKKGVEINMSPS